MLTARAWLFPVLLGLCAATSLLHALPLSDEKLDSTTSTTTDNSNTTGGVCLYEGVVYAKGEKTAKPGPCEECVCQPPSVVCSMIKCPVQSGCRIIQRVNQCCPDYKCECEYNGQMYNNGERLDTRDEPCKVCYCKGGEVMCTSISCYHRDDCEPRFVAGQCCPKYDHCPLKDINPLDERDDTLSANNRSYVYSPKREMQPWLLTKSVEVKVVPTAPTQIVPNSSENNTASSSFETTTRSNDEQQQTWNNIIVSDWLTERRTTTAEDDSTRITAYGYTDNDINIKNTPTTENTAPTDSNTDTFVTDQENRTKTVDTTSDTTSVELVTEVVSEHVTETGTELNTVITETPYMDKLVTIVFKETPSNGFTTITPDIIYNEGDERRTEMPPLHFVTQNTGDTNIPFTKQEIQDFEENDKVHSMYELTNEVKRFASTEPSFVETSSEFPEENNTILLTENTTGITGTDYEITTDVDVTMSEANETKTEPEEEADKSGNFSTKNNASMSPEEMITTTTDSVEPNDLVVTQSVLNSKNEHLNENNSENQMLKDTNIVNLKNDKQVYGNSDRNVATVNNDNKNSYSEDADTTIETVTISLNNEDSLNTQNLQSDLLDSKRVRENSTVNEGNNDSVTEIASNPEKLDQTDRVDSGIGGDNLQQELANSSGEEQSAEKNIKQSDSQENEQSDDHVIHMYNVENSEADSGEEIGTEINSFNTNSHDNNKNTDDYSYEPPVLELNSQLPFLQIGGHGSMEILSTDVSEENNSSPEIENLELSIEEQQRVNSTTTDASYEEAISSSTHIPLTPGDLKILAEYLINEKITPTKNESSTYMPTEWLKGNLTSNTTKIASILSAANISIGIINRNKSDGTVKLTDSNLENKTLLQESVPTQTLENLLNNKDSVTEVANLEKDKNNNNGDEESEDTVVTIPSSLEVTNTDINESVNTEDAAVTEIPPTTSYYTLNKDNSFVENLNESNNQIQHDLNKTAESGKLKEMIRVKNKTENIENIINEDINKKNLSLLVRPNSNGDTPLSAGENGLTKNNEVDSSSTLGNMIKQDNKELYMNVFYPEDDNSNNTNTLKNLSNHKKRINPGESDEYTSRKVRIPEMESIVKEPFSASLDDNDLTILKEFLKKHMVIP